MDGLPASLAGPASASPATIRLTAQPRPLGQKHGVKPRLSLIAWASLILAIVAAGFGIWAARDLLVPIAIAAVLSIMLAPVAAMIERLGAPPLLAAALLVSAGLALLVGLLYLAAPDAARLARQLPQTFVAVENKLEALREALAPLTAASERVQEVTRLARPVGPDEEAPWPVVMRNNSASWLSMAMSRIGGAAVQVGFSTVLIVFMLGERRRVRCFFMRAAPDNAARRRLAAMMLDIRTRVSRFLLAQTLSNLGLGAASAVALAVIDFPGALIWGVAVFLGNFIPYAGGFAVQIACLIYGLATLPTVEAALIAPIILALLNFLEGQFITPWVVGRHVVISPLAVLLAVGFGGWVWGAAGALVAVPGLIVGASALQHWWNPVATRPGSLRINTRRRIYQPRAETKRSLGGRGTQLASAR